MRHYSFWCNINKSKEEKSDRKEIERQLKLTRKHHFFLTNAPPKIIADVIGVMRKRIEMDLPRLSDIPAFPSRWILQMVCQDLVVMQ